VCCSADEAETRMRGRYNRDLTWHNGKTFEFGFQSCRIASLDDCNSLPTVSKNGRGNTFDAKNPPSRYGGF
jgi:hypothetical protein